MEETFALLRTHHKNVQRYRQLLQTHLTDFEREYIRARLREEQLVIEMLSSASPTETSSSDPRAAQITSAAPKPSASKAKMTRPWTEADLIRLKNKGLRRRYC